MLRIYLDKQIISYLQKPLSGKEDIYKDLLNLLRKNEGQFCLIYSVAHLMDFLKDKSDYKEADLNFMGELGFINFMNHDFHESCLYLANVLPRERYNRGNFNVKIDYKLRAGSPVFKRHQAQLRMLYNIYLPILKKVNNNPINVKKLSERERGYYYGLKEIVPFDIKSITERKFIKYLQKHYEKLSSQPIKKFRPFINDIIESTKSKFVVPSTKPDFTKPNIRKDLFNTDLQNFFLECMCTHVFMLGNHDLSQVNNEFHLITFYTMLELTGVLNEKPSKLNIQSMVADGEHATFGCYCDILITEDKKLFQKAKLLYGLLDMNTLVFKPEEFLEYYKNYQNIVISNKDQIADFCQTDVYRFLVKEKEEYGNTIDEYFIDSQWRYLGFFNTIHYKCVNDMYWVGLYRLTNNYSSPWTLQEIKNLVNSTFQTYGPDINGNTSFDESIETTEFQRNIWRGRKWLFSGMEARLFSDIKKNYHVMLTIGSFKSPVI